MGAAIAGFPQNRMKNKAAAVVRVTQVVLRTDEEIGSRIWVSEDLGRRGVWKTESREDDRNEGNALDDDLDDGDGIDSRVLKLSEESGFENDGKWWQCCSLPRDSIADGSRGMGYTALQNPDHVAHKVEDEQ